MRRPHACPMRRRRRPSVAEAPPGGVASGQLPPRASRFSLLRWLFSCMLFLQRHRTMARRASWRVQEERSSCPNKT